MLPAMISPDPVTPAYLRSLIEGAGISQGQAARMLRVDPRTLRRWLAGDRACPWMAAELLRRMITNPGSTTRLKGANDDR